MVCGSNTLWNQNMVECNTTKEYLYSILFFFKVLIKLLLFYAYLILTGYIVTFSGDRLDIGHKELLVLRSILA